ncbi:MAG: phosphatidylglycerophosphatase A [Erysipelotrichaceae bacterium]|nr:MAG: phosphatidylglycerophosphatase [Erysipelotrichaceae bacterium]TXT18885.1 MAG: phosphatidylglycerophosphatase A [Erysipelotrichaceae bacterium]
MYDKCVKLLQERGVTLEDIGDLVLFLQGKYHPEIGMEEIMLTVKGVVAKREVQHAIMTGILIDQIAESNFEMDEQLRMTLMNDESLYGIDEVLAYGICNLYGSIALTNYGYIDREKPGILATINEHCAQCNVFLDDIVGAIAASAASKIAHTHGK